MLGCLQLSQMVWPGMGSEVTYELYEGPSNRNNGHGKREPSTDSQGNNGHDNNGHDNNGHGSNGKQYYLRVMWGGQPMKTSTPMGTIDLIPVETFFDCKYSIYFSYQKSLSDEPL
jgi:acid phosphatase